MSSGASVYQLTLKPIIGSIPQIVSCVYLHVVHTEDRRTKNASKYQYIFSFADRTKPLSADISLMLDRITMYDFSNPHPGAGQSQGKSKMII